ncbi:glycosyl hydrolase [Rhodovulum sp. MB263]|uniref:glycosyl hydrolase n=1 Tax=Rhodovulum sp. (strain MB263) TaxID=308754 RepID=UPI0021012C9B|nr:glycosyl hydrolase [Rhodovulum sp. MB263]
MSLTGPALARKAGIGAWENSQYTTIRWIEEQPALEWYYTWRTDQLWTAMPVPRSVEFVPMIHSERDLAAEIRPDLPVGALLTFNVPNGHGAHQGGLSVARALALWPQVEARGRGSGSAAPPPPRLERSAPAPGSAGS